LRTTSTSGGRDEGGCPHRTGRSGICGECADESRSKRLCPRGARAVCGIAGFYDAVRQFGEPELRATAGHMTEALRHRGPDSSGIWVDPEAGMVLGHRRLAIIDLSNEGHQPMVSAGGQLVVVFNGEIYNFRSLKRELVGLGWRFRGKSDTEVLLAAVEQWGLDQALVRMVGMFAFALWDRSSRTLHLVRDRLGKKPLYFGWVGQGFLFASELKAFHTHPEFAPEVDRGALALLLRHSYVPAPYSIYRDIFKLPPAGRLSLHLNGSNAPHGCELCDLIEPYWSALAVAENGAATPLALDEVEATEQLDDLLNQAVAERMIADVPLGALLSGGIDSSTVTALMQKQSSRPIKTFSIGFSHAQFNEAPDAKRVARHLGTDHSELYVTPKEAQAVIPRLPDFYDEPFADESQIPTFLVSQLARQHVTVALSGDGGDEVFGGYDRHFQGHRLARLNRLPLTLRRSLARLLTVLPPEGWDRLFAGMGPALSARVRRILRGERVHRFADILSADNGLAAIYGALVSHWTEPTAVVRGTVEPPTALGDPGRWPDLKDFIHAMMVLDTVSFLPDDILTKVDRASMAVSLEVRAPLLDHRVVEFAWRLPIGMKVRDTVGKRILRRVLYRYVAPDLVERPKQGFGVPLEGWLRGPLKEWAEALLEEKRLEDEGYFNPGPIRQAWAEHLSGRRDYAYHLWDILMFQAWQERWL
jgi:asparagine synthase (glutamine-hydrolysing)